MGTRKTEVHRSALPLLRRIKDGRLKRQEVEKKLDIKPQHLTNWLTRGVPARRLPDVAAVCDLSTDEYRLEAGMVIRARGKDLLAQALLTDFRALPEGLREHIARKTAALRELCQDMPKFLMESLKPPKDPEKYKEWERDIEILMARFRTGGDD